MTAWGKPPMPLIPRFSGAENGTRALLWPNVPRVRDVEGALLSLPVTGAKRSPEGPGPKGDARILRRVNGLCSELGECEAPSQLLVGGLTPQEVGEQQPAHCLDAGDVVCDGFVVPTHRLEVDHGSIAHQEGAKGARGCLLSGDTLVGGFTSHVPPDKRLQVARSSLWNANRRNAETFTFPHCGERESFVREFKRCREPFREPCGGRSVVSVLELVVNPGVADVGDLSQEQEVVGAVGR